jgi:hypothetical protein
MNKSDFFGEFCFPTSASASSFPYPNYLNSSREYSLQGPTGACGPPGIPGYPPLSNPQDPLYEKILETLRLATFAHHEGLPNSYLLRLAQRLRADVQKDIDAWKSLMGADRAPVDKVDKVDKA